MKEIIYLQAGQLANYVGTHFWNTQEAYFTYDQNHHPIVCRDISFCERLVNKNEPVLCPRLLAFDRKVNFGTLGQSNALSDMAAEGNQDQAGMHYLWPGATVEYKQDVIPKSEYQSFMETEATGAEEDEEELPESDFNVRYWSDFSRVYYLPQTVQRLPDVADWEKVEGNWVLGEETFRRYDEETDLMEDSFRLLVEDCDEVQGIHIMNDTAAFGAFTNSFLTSFRDEYSKLPSISFPFLSDAIPGHIDVDDLSGMRKAVADGLYMRNLYELSTMNVPLQSPSAWTHGSWSSNLSIDFTKIYHSSALLSAHIESSTLPLRLTGTTEGLADFCAQLAAGGNFHFAQLAGAFPWTAFPDGDIDRRQYNFTVDQHESHRIDVPFSVMDTTRGFESSDILLYDIWRDRAGLKPPVLQSVHAPKYPIPTSFPSIIRNPSTAVSSASPNIYQPHKTSLKVLSTLGNSGELSHLFAAYAKYVDECTRRGVDLQIGLEHDELRELGNDLWIMADSYGDEDTQHIDEGLSQIDDDED